MRYFEIHFELYDILESSKIIAWHDFPTILESRSFLPYSYRSIAEITFITETNQEEYEKYWKSVLAL